MLVNMGFSIFSTHTTLLILVGYCNYEPFHHLVIFSYCHLIILSSYHHVIVSSCHHHCIVQTGLFAFHICHFVSPPKGKRCHLGAINTVAPDTVLAQKDFPLQNSHGLRYLRLKS